MKSYNIPLYGLVLLLTGIASTCTPAYYEQKQKEKEDRKQEQIYILLEMLKDYESCQHPDAIPINRNNGLGFRCINEKVESGLIVNYDTWETIGPTASETDPLFCVQYHAEEKSYSKGNNQDWYILVSDSKEDLPNISLVLNQIDVRDENGEVIGYKHLTSQKKGESYYCIDHYSDKYQIVSIE